MKKNLFFFFLMILLWSCNSTNTQNAGSTVEDNVNPPAEGFNAEASDPKAIALADSVMNAMGGRKAWDNTHYISWNFFGARNLLWDKKEGTVRIEIPRDSTIFLVNIFDKTGKAQVQGEEITEPDSLAKLMDRAEAIWINDAYWLVMPFKLKDSGVTLKYLGQDTTEQGRPAEVLELTFREVGNTPNNKYHVYIDSETNLITQWDFYTNASDEEPRFSTPWDDYRRFGDILLSGDRGQRQISDIAVYDEAPEAVFQDFSAHFND